MSERARDIDRIVQEVLAELGLGPPAADAATRPGPADADPAPEAPSEKPPAAAELPTGDLMLHCRVVTQAEVAGRLEAVRRLVVPAQAVVTPAVRDELRRRNVTLSFAPPAAEEAPGRVRLVMVTMGRRFDPGALLSALSKEGIAVEGHRSDCLVEATDRLAAEVARGDTLGLLLTRHTPIALCLANRHRGVRAVTAVDAQAVATAAASVGANLLVIDPTVQASFQLRQSIREFCRGGVRDCPEALRPRLA